MSGCCNRNYCLFRLVFKSVVRERFFSIFFFLSEKYCCLKFFLSKTSGVLEATDIFLSCALTSKILKENNADQVFSVRLVIHRRYWNWIIFVPSQNYYELYLQFSQSFAQSQSIQISHISFHLQEWNTKNVLQKVFISRKSPVKGTSQWEKPD